MRGIPDHVVEWQQFIEKYWAKEKERLGKSYLVALHNLHLPEGRLTLKNQKGLSYVVFNFIEPIAESLEAPPTIGNNRPAALGIDTPLGSFMFMPDMMGYPEPDEKGIHLPGEEAWWNSEDFDAFQRSYRHLCGVIESSIEGENYWNFCRADIEWLDEKMRLIHNEVYLRIKVKNPPLNGGKARSKRKRPQNHSSLIPLCQFRGVQKQQPELANIPFETFSPVITSKIKHDLPPSDLILYQAYLELIDVINQNESFRRCTSPVCRKIFVMKDRVKKYCNSVCRGKGKQKTDELSNARWKPDYKGIAAKMAELPIGKETEAGEIAKKLGRSAQSIGRMLRKGKRKTDLETELEKQGRTYTSYHDGRQLIYKFDETQ